MEWISINIKPFVSYTIKRSSKTYHQRFKRPTKPGSKLKRNLKRIVAGLIVLELILDG